MLISAQAGAGVTTLLARWLADAECFQPCAWLSLAAGVVRISVLTFILTVFASNPVHNALLVGVFRETLSALGVLRGDYRTIASKQVIASSSMAAAPLTVK